MSRPTGKKIAVIDIGSNTSKALIATVEKDGQVVALSERGFPCRLISSAHISTLEIVEKDVGILLEILGELLKFCMENSPDHLVVVATEAIRKSRNAHKIIAAIEKIYSVRLFVLSGQQEAEFIAQGLKCDPQIYNQTSIQAFDLGGGSLELIQSRESCPIIVKSMELGAIYLAEKYLVNKNQPLGEDEQGELRNLIRVRISDCGLSKHSDFTLIGLGGAIFFLRKILSKRKSVNFADCQEFSKLDISKLGGEICQMKLEDRIKEFPDLPADRADVFPVACLIIEGIMDVFQQNRCRHSIYNLRYGIASSFGTSESRSDFLC